MYLIKIFLGFQIRYIRGLCLCLQQFCFFVVFNDFLCLQPKTLDDLTYPFHIRYSLPELSFTYQYTSNLNVIISYKSADLFGDIEDLKECFDRYPNSQSWLKIASLDKLCSEQLDKAYFIHTLLLFVSNHITIHWNLTRNSVKECFNKPYPHTQTQPQHHHFIGNILQADWLQSRAVTRFLSKWRCAKSSRGI